MNPVVTFFYADLTNMQLFIHNQRQQYLLIKKILEAIFYPTFSIIEARCSSRERRVIYGLLLKSLFVTS